MYQKSSKAGSRSEISQWNNPEQTGDASKLNKMGNILTMKRHPPLQHFVQVDTSTSSSGIKDNQTTDPDQNVCGHLKKEVSSERISHQVGDL